MDLSDLQGRLDVLENRYQEWAAPLNRAIQDRAYRINRGGYTGDDFHRDLLRLDVEHKAEYDPYPEFYALFDELCPAYLEAGTGERAAIRALIGERKGTVHAMLGYVNKASNQLRATGDTTWLRLGLAGASIENSRRDYRDLLLSLAELYVAAEERGLDPAAEFARVAELSDTEKPAGGPTAVSEMLARFHRSAVLEERQRHGARL